MSKPTQQAPKRAALYRRVSTGKQVEDGQSLEGQHARLQEYAASRGWTLVGDYCDAGVSGRRDDRPELQRALADAEAGAYNVLIVAALDRFGRNTRHALGNFDRLEAAGAELVSLREQIDTTTPGGAFVRTLFAAFAEMESALISERTSAGLAEARKAGNWTTGPPPTGYDVKDKRLVIDDAWAPLVRRIFSLALAGAAPAAIARAMNAEGLRSRSGRPWTRRSVQAILTNAAYSGRYARHRDTPDEYLVDAPHTALVSVSDWEKVQRLVQERDRVRAAAAREQRARGGKAPSRFVLGRLGVCGYCGGRMYAVRSGYVRKRDGQSARRYVCGHAQEATGLCSAPPVDAELVDRTIIENLHTYVLDAEAWLLEAEATAGAERRHAEEHLRTAQAAVTAAARRVRRAEEMLVDADEDRAAALLDILVRQRAAHERAVVALDAARDAHDSTPEEPMALAAGQLRRAALAAQEAADIAALNARLRDDFQGFVLLGLPGGAVSIEPRWTFPAVVQVGGVGLDGALLTVPQAQDHRRMLVELAERHPELAGEVDETIGTLDLLAVVRAALTHDDPAEGLSEVSAWLYGDDGDNGGPLDEDGEPGRGGGSTSPSAGLAPSAQE